MVTIRSAKPGDATSIARVHIDMWRVAYNDIIGAEYLRQLSYSRSRAHWHRFIKRHSGVIVVADSTDDGIIGFAAGGSERTGELGVDGELMALYVLASHHRKGVGRRLSEDMSRRLEENGRNGMAVWVLADNPAVDFYRHLGGREVSRRTIEIDDQSLSEIAFILKEAE